MCKLLLPQVQKSVSNIIPFKKTKLIFSKDSLQWAVSLWLGATCFGDTETRDCKEHPLAKAAEDYPASTALPL